MDSKFLAIPCAVEINSLGSMTFFDVVNTIDACRYSNLSLSNPLVIPSPVYILTCICIETQMNEMKCKNSCSYMKHPVLILAGVFISKNSKDLSTSMPRISLCFSFCQKTLLELQENPSNDYTKCDMYVGNT